MPDPDVRGCLSFSLYGDDPKYVLGMKENVALARGLYRGWAVRVHADRGHYAIPDLRRLGADVVEHDPAPGSRGMFWRFETAADPAFTHVCVRDADSRLGHRDRAAVEAWVASGRGLHVMRDHPAHEYKAVIGGAWGVRTDRAVARDVVSRIAAWPHTNQYGDDEDFLAKHVWEPFTAPDAPPRDFLRHTFNPNGPDSLPFPPHVPDPGAGHVCEPRMPAIDGKVRVVCLNPDKFPNRMANFRRTHARSRLLSRWPLERWRGRDRSEEVVPPTFQGGGSDHHFLASRDHQEIVRDTILKGYDLLFCFEDDAEVAPDFDDRLAACWADLPRGWQALMMGWNYNPQRERVTDRLARFRGTTGYNGMLWSRAGMVRMHGHAFNWPNVIIDHVLAGLQSDDAKIYGPNGPPFVTLLDCPQLGSGDAPASRADGRGASTTVLPFPDVAKRVAGYTMVGAARLRNLYDLAVAANDADRPGAFVECGCCNGGSGAVLAHVARAHGRRVCLFDSFRGLPEPTAEDYAGSRRSPDGMAGECRGSTDRVEEVLRHVGADRSRVVIYPGWFADTFPVSDPNPIAVLHVDADFYAPVKLALERFWDALVPGGVCVLDDWGYWGGCRRAAEEFFAARGLTPAWVAVDDEAVYCVKR